VAGVTGQRAGLKTGYLITLSVTGAGISTCLLIQTGLAGTAGLRAGIGQAALRTGITGGTGMAGIGSGTTV